MTSNSLSRPLIDRLIPISAAFLRIPLQIVIGVALLALLAQLRITVAGVPITGQSLGVLLIAAAYGLNLGTLTMLAYLLVGGLGLGVFSGGAAGWAAFTGTTGGYLVGFILATIVVGFLAARGWDRHYGLMALAMLLGNIAIYLPGLYWLNSFAPDIKTTLAWGLTPFVVGDLIKLAFAVALLPSVWQLIGKKS